MGIGYGTGLLLVESCEIRLLFTRAQLPTRMAAFRAAFKAFKTKRPLAFNCITYGTLYAGAEFSQQTLLRKILVSEFLLNSRRHKNQLICMIKKFLKAEKPEDYDFKLISRYALLGTAVFPPILFYWYKWLDGRFVGTAVKIVASKVVIDQAVSAPLILGLFYTGYFHLPFFLSKGTLKSTKL